MGRRGSQRKKAGGRGLTLSPLSPLETGWEGGQDRPRGVVPVGQVVHELHLRPLKLMVLEGV